MKKIISIVLLLSLCLGLFAGCTPAVEPQQPASNLENAKSLVFNTYKPANKDEIPFKSVDFEVMTSVLVDGETFPVAWTVEVTEGPAEAVQIVDGSSEAFKKVDLTEKPEVDVKFTLTATISDAEGNTATVSFKYQTPKFEAPSAEKIVLKIKDIYITGTEYLYTGKMKYQLETSDKIADAIAFTMIENADGTNSFKTDDGYFLFCDANHVQFVTEESDNTKFVLEIADGGYFIKCAVANYNGKAQYLEYYSNYLTCYGMGSDASIYTFALEAADGANGKVVKYSEGGSTEPTTPPATEPTVTEPTVTEPTVTEPSTGNKVVLTVDSLGLASQSYSASTATVGGVGFEWIQLGNYGDGIQVRDKDGKTSMFWNTTAFGAPITKIELVYSSTKDVTYANPDCAIFSFGNGVDSYTYTTKLSTTAGVKTYTITPDAETYTFMKFEHDLGYSMYWASITIYLADGTVVPGTPSEPTEPEVTEPTVTEPTVTEPTTPAPSVTLENGSKIVIVCGAHNKALSSQPASSGSFYQLGVDVVIANGAVTGYADTEVWTVIAHADGTYSFAQGGQNLGMQASYSSMSLGAVNDKWELIPADNGTFVIKNVVRGNCIEWYASKNNWSTYTTSSLSDPLFNMSIFVVEGGSAQPPVTEPETTEPAPTEPEVTEPAPTEPEVTEPEATQPSTDGAKGSADFGSFDNLSSSGADSTYTKTHTTTNGWTSVNSAIQAGGTTDMNPNFKVFGPDNTYKAVCLNGRTSAVGKLTSPTLTGGINKLTFNYTKCFTDTKLGVTVTITDLATGTAYTKDLDVEMPKNEKYTVCDFEFVLDAPIAGDFTVEIVNKCPTGQDGNKDRISIWNLNWY